MKIVLSFLAAAMFLLSPDSATWAGEKKADTGSGSQKAAQKPAYEKSDLTTATATVEAVDLATRMVTLRREKGDTFTFKAGKEIRNLPQVKVGDQVIVRYYESLMIEVKKPGEAKPGVATEGATLRAKPGEKPAGVTAEQVTVTATVQAIDSKKPSVTLKGPEGKAKEIKIKDSKKLENVKVGDLVVITYVEALGISVEKAAKK